MKKSLTILAFAAAMILAGCQREADNPNAGLKEIKFKASLDLETKVTATSFEEGDVIGLSVGEPIDASRVKLTYTGGALTPEKTLYWPESMAYLAEASFMAWYPYDIFGDLDPMGNTIHFIIARDQYREGKYEESDLLAAVTSASPAQETVALEFRHKFSRLKLNVVDQLTSDSFRDSQADSFRSIGLKGLKRQAGVNLAEGSVEAYETSEDVIYPMRASEMNYWAIVVPQTATPEIVVTLNSGETRTYVSSVPITFTSGKQLSATLTLSDEAVSFQWNIVDWEDDDQKIVFVQPTDGQPDNEIWYTSTNGEIVELYNVDGFGANIISHTYEDGKGIIKFDGPVTAIGRYSFGSYVTNGRKLATIEIPNSVTLIGDGAFTSCESLSWPVIPSSVTKIDSGAFFGCNGLVDVVIPETVTEFGESIFQGCPNLQSITSAYSSADKRCLIIDGVLNSFAFAGLGDTYVFPDDVTTIGNSALRNSRYSGNLVIGDNVKRIEGEAFAYMQYMKSIKIGNGVTYIGSSAFYGFGSRNPGMEIELPASLTTVGVDVFPAWLSKLTIHAVVPPASWGAILSDDSADQYPPYPIYVPAQSVEAYKTARYWSDYAERIFPIGQPNNEIWYTSTDGNIIEFAGTDYSEFGASLVSNTYQNGEGVLLFDGDVSAVGQFFTSNTALKTISLPESVKRISASAFEACRQLEEIHLPNHLEYCGEAILYRTAIHEIYFPETDRIEGNPFERCEELSVISGPYASADGRALIKDNVLYSFAPAGLTEYTIPDGVTTIGRRAFRYCRNLTSVIIPDSVTEIGSRAFFYCKSISSFDIPGGVTVVGDSAFSGMTSLESFTGSLATEDGRGLVVDAMLVAVAPNGLTSWVIPSGVTAIGSNAFFDCYLTFLTIPQSVESIGYSAFSSAAITEFYVLPTTPPALDGNYVFSSSSDYTIYVPAASVNAYKTAQYWSDLGERVQAFPEPEPVDLGLESGTKWASFNLGAGSPEGAGCVFAWGELGPSKYNAQDNLVELQAEDDAVVFWLGTDWRMPTSEQIDELVNNCTFTVITLDGVQGYEAKSNINDNTLFLPYVDEYPDLHMSFYWSSTLRDEENAYVLAIFPDLGVQGGNSCARYTAHPIRPVYVGE